MIDCATYEPGRDPLTDLDVIENEFVRHGEFADRQRLVALNKVDIPDARDLAEMTIDDLRGRGLPVFTISTKTGEGINALVYAMADLVQRLRAARPSERSSRW